MAMMEVVMIDTFGSREVMKFRKIPIPTPGLNEILPKGDGGERQPDRLEDPRRPISRGQIRQAALRLSMPKKAQERSLAAARLTPPKRLISSCR